MLVVKNILTNVMCRVNIDLTIIVKNFMYLEVTPHERKQTDHRGKKH